MPYEPELGPIGRLLILSAVVFIIVTWLVGLLVTLDFAKNMIADAYYWWKEVLG